ncbi:predicted protein [Sclerotinia sclerotiorum 1980 UF-70]|uniref:Uncharacterized protein n=2 Tax=Sclerotinia sclerotiorum (strain ATCC 18683 / 1980 / Ss-1) TaxID=665079 RepID=A7E8P6_SCLS1|nr:predicted protein [Sclerotinia sclerotiorum 1980 UF-70]APA05927.1 hypothetical protein sscle_01g006970 [Sclerotinia sclerotiorum 1980 UF-70]EDN96748.1 predicted protein [Sclerotinia sclerotiorum 1980 UF-70]
MRFPPKVNTNVAILFTFKNLRKIGENSVISLSYPNSEVKVAQLMALPAAHNESTTTIHRGNSGNRGGRTDFDDAASFCLQMEPSLSIDQ